MKPRSLVGVALLLLSAVASARPVPELICREARLISIDPKTLAVLEQTSGTVYRFTSGSLYIKPVDRSEYRYNNVIEMEPNRYASGHKVIQFEGDGSLFESAILVHTYRDEVRVSRATCSTL